jgi:DNA-binding response OmpR family regulator
VRKKDKKIPIIIISNMVQYDYLEKAFQLWAHDYLMKPFRVRELQIRIQRWFHSYIFSEFFSYEKTLRYHELEYLPSSNEFFLEWEKIQLSKSSKHLLSLLLVNREQLLSQTFLAEKIWWYTESLHRKNLRIKVLRLKNTLKECGIDHRIKTVHGEWYILEKS